MEMIGGLNRYEDTFGVTLLLRCMIPEVMYYTIVEAKENTAKLLLLF